MRAGSRGATVRGSELRRAPLQNDVDLRHKPAASADGGDPVWSPARREKRSSEYLARLLDTRMSSDAACCTGLRNRLVTSTDMMGATDMTANATKQVQGEVAKKDVMSNGQLSIDKKTSIALVHMLGTARMHIMHAAGTAAGKQSEGANPEDNQSGLLAGC